MMDSNAIEWSLSIVILALIASLAAFTLWAVLQALKPVEQQPYDVVREASRIAMRRWYRQEDEVA